MQTEADVKKLEDTIDNLSEIGELWGRRTRNFFKLIGSKTLIYIGYFIFGFLGGLLVNFIKGIFSGKKNNF